ncbi:hypothetical protein BKA70DRAFT_1227666 [Coprinopsis sp. MPI-PUGE-AT-0042]|nr:hypothetical protein BKA70DRAFT_1227666 [Coprinopsis sp. MPI-PUGE-AT-0042]
MDAFYDVAKASKLFKAEGKAVAHRNPGENLENITQEHQGAALKANQTMLLASIDMGPRQILRMMEHVDGEAEPIEAYFRVQGVICDKLLPPVGRNSMKNGKKSRTHLRQAITISGIGSPTFEKAIANLELAYLEFSNHFEEGHLAPWTPSSHGTFSAIDAYAKYFSHKEEFDPKVDPKGVLSALVDNDFFHGPDNVVDYMQMTSTPEGRYTYKKVDPILFKIGDIVEITVALACFPTKDKKTATMAVILKSVMMLDSDERNVPSGMGKQDAEIKKPAKRRATYDEHIEEAETEARERMSRMNIG